MRTIFFLALIIFYSCDKNINEDNQLNISNKRIKNNCIIDSSLYYSLDYISWSDSWIDNVSKKEYIYRILLSSSSEEKYLYYEKFKIGEDGPISFIKREKIEPDIFGLKYFNLSLKAEWKSYNELNINLDDTTFEYKIK